MKKFAFLLAILFSVSICFALEPYKSGVTASFYGADFHGKKTSSGELFNMYDYTCANKELPFNTVLKVTNLANGKSVQVRVNDRGPFVIGREIDLSTAAAKALDMIKTGTTKVKLEIVTRGPNTKQSVATAESAKKIMAEKSGTTIATIATTKASATKSATAKSSSAAQGKIWDIQVASFKNRENAEKLAKELHNKGFEKLVYQSTKDVTRVVVSKVPDADVEKMSAKLRAAGYNDFVIKERKNG